MSTLSIIAIIITVVALFALWYLYHTRARTIMMLIAAGAMLLLILSLIAGQVTISLPGTTASQPVNLTEAMKAEIKQQLDTANKTLVDKVSALETSVKAVTEKDIEQDKQIAELQGRVSTLENDMKQVKSDVTALKARLKSVEDGDITVTGSPTDLTTDQAAQALADELVAQGWQADQINVGSIDWSKNPYDNGRETFVNRTIRTQQDLARVLAHPKNGAERAVRAHILKSLEGMPESERQRAMSGKGFVPVQFLDESCFNGNTFYNASTGTAEREAGDVCKKAGDVWWIYVDSAGKVQWDTAVRADCGNPGLTRPPRPKHPKPTPPPTTAPPTTAPPTTTPPTTAPPTTLQPKPSDPSSYVHKTSAPPATVTQPADPAPPTVETSKPAASPTRSTPPPATGANSPDPTDTACVPARGKTSC